MNMVNEIKLTEKRKEEVKLFLDMNTTVHNSVFYRKSPGILCYKYLVRIRVSFFRKELQSVI